MENNTTSELQKIEKNPQVVALRKRVPDYQAIADRIEIKTKEDELLAQRTLLEIKEHKTLGTKLQKFFADPHDLYIKKIKEIFKPSIDLLTNADTLIRNKLVAYVNEQEHKANLAKAKVTTQIEAGKINIETGVKKLEKIQEPQKTVRSDEGTMSYTVRKRVVIENPELLPREYLIPDEVKIRKVVLAGVTIPGCKIVEDKIPSLRSNS